MLRLANSDNNHSADHSVKRLCTRVENITHLNCFTLLVGGLSCDSLRRTDHCVGLQIKFTWGRKLLSDFVFRKEPIEIAFKQLVLYDSIFFKFGFGMEFCLFSTDFPRTISNSRPLNSRKPSSRADQSCILIGILRSACSSA